MTQPLHIAIIGAGIAGCTLARLLQIQGISCTIFEAEARADVRSQGGTLDLHEDTGLLAIKAAGLFSEFKAHARTEGDALRLCDKRMRTWLSIGSTADGSWLAQAKPEIDREALRRILLDSLLDGTVRWGKRVSNVVIDVKGKDNFYKVNFTDGSEESGWSLIAGADGAWSKVRPMISAIRPFYSGVGGFTAKIDDARKKTPELYRLVNRGSWFNYSDGSMILGQQMGDGSIYVSVWNVQREDWREQADYDVWSGRAVSMAMCKKYQDWSPEVQKLLGALDEEGVVPRSLYMLPVDFRWEHVPGLTLLGDAAHLMTPFTGEGVNAAMRDAYDLSVALGATSKSGNGSDTLEQDVRKYEKAMFTRVNKVQKRTQDMMEMMLFTEGAPGTVIERWIVRSMSDDIHPVLLIGVRLIVYTVYFFYKYLLV